MGRSGLYVIQVRMTSRPTQPQNGCSSQRPLFEKAAKVAAAVWRLWRPWVENLKKT